MTEADTFGRGRWGGGPGESR